MMADVSGAIEAGAGAGEQWLEHPAIASSHRWARFSHAYVISLTGRRSATSRATLESQKVQRATFRKITHSKNTPAKPLCSSVRTLCAIGKPVSALPGWRQCATRSLVALQLPILARGLD